MSIPPCLMHVRIHNEEHNFGLWLPLFLAWLILAALLLAILPILLILLIVALPFGWGEFMLLLGPRFYNILCALRGLKVEIDRTSEEVLFV
jgi:predicted permease